MHESYEKFAGRWEFSSGIVNEAEKRLVGCEYWDCGWCYKKDSVYSSCVGAGECKYKRGED